MARASHNPPPELRTHGESSRSASTGTPPFSSDRPMREPSPELWETAQYQRGPR